MHVVNHHVFTLSVGLKSCGSLNGKSRYLTIVITNHLRFLPYTYSFMPYLNEDSNVSHSLKVSQQEGMKIKLNKIRLKYFKDLW